MLPTDKDAILEDIRLHAYIDRVLPDVREHMIRKARKAGATDTEIAKVLGVSRQAVAKAAPR